MAPLAWFRGMPHKVRASCTLDLSGQDWRRVQVWPRTATHGWQSNAVLFSRCPARQSAAVATTSGLAGFQRLLTVCRRSAGLL